MLTANRNRLLQEGFHVESAKDGLEAIKMLTLFAPDLVVLDLMLPKFSGVDVLKFIRTNPGLKTVPVIILSMTSVTDTTQESVLELANRRLIKDLCPVDALVQTIRDVLAETSQAGTAAKLAAAANELNWNVKAV